MGGHPESQARTSIGNTDMGGIGCGGGGGSNVSGGNSAFSGSGGFSLGGGGAPAARAPPLVAL